MGGLLCVIACAQGLERKQARAEYVKSLRKECPEYDVKFRLGGHLGEAGEGVIFGEGLLAREDADVFKKCPSLRRAIEFADDFERCCVDTIRATDRFKNGDFDALLSFIKEEDASGASDVQEILDRLPEGSAEAAGEVVGIIITCGLKHHRTIRDKFWSDE